MSKRAKQTITALLGSLLIAVVCYALCSAGAGPTCHGRSLEAWLGGYDTPVGDARIAYRKEADEAIRQAGIKAIPVALRMLQARESKLATSFQLKRLDLAYRLHWINANTYAVQRMRLPAAWIDRKSGAARVFEVLGYTAKDAVPALTNMYEQNLDAVIRGEAGSYSAGAPGRWAVGCLRSIGPAASAAIPSLVRGLTLTNAGTVGLKVRSDACYALVGIHAQPGVVVPYLIQALQDPSADGILRARAAEALGNFGADALGAVPALVAWLHTTNREARYEARNALLKIAPEAAAKEGVK